MTEPTIDGVLGAAAFGADPGRWPLPSAAEPGQLFLRAVAAGGQGRYAAAEADLAALLRAVPAGPLAALAHATRASFLRQLGWHVAARGHDGRAAALVGPEAKQAPQAREARVEALTGLAADALGVGRFAASAALLARAAGLPEPLTTPPHRSAIRCAWVGAELAMAVGDAAAALPEAERAVHLAADCGSARHQVKSAMVLAAALCCAGRVDRARVVADDALDAAGRLGLVPLRWALACLLADVGTSAHSPQQISGIRDRCAELVRRRGGRWR